MQPLNKRKYLDTAESQEINSSSFGENSLDLTSNEIVEGATHQLTVGGEARRCEKCHSLHIISQLFEHFNVPICFVCSKMMTSSEGENEYQLITKTEAKERYLLSESDFNSLPSLEKQNPHKLSWNPMKLFLRQHVTNCFAPEAALTACAIKRWGGELQIEEERSRRESVRLEAKRRKAKALSVSLRSPTPVSGLIPDKAPHFHTYPPELETYDSAKDEWTKSCKDCGFKVKFERF